MTLRKLLPLALAALLAACGGELQDQATSLDSAPASSAVSTNGRLKVCGNRICNASGTAVQLRGMSYFWSNTGWGAERFYNTSSVANLANGWGATVVRAAIGADGGGGYMDTSARSANVARAKALIDGAIAAGIYVIVDFHSHELHQTEAQQFFGDLAGAYASSPNIIWEPFNEPTSQNWSSQLKPYHTAVINTIRSKGSQNLVVVGNPTWSQDVDVATNDPIADTNTAYTLHFYAGTHGSYLRSKADTAMSRNKAVFVTEWGTCDASGNGGFNATESQNWASWMDTNKISSANWSLNDKAETASALVGGASATGPWADSALTQSGLWVKAYISKGGGGGGGGTTTYTLTVTRSGTGTGTVTGGNINCGSTCSATYNSGTTVTLNAAAASGSTFAGWSNACSGTGACVVTMSAARTVTATFNGSGGGTTYYALNVSKSGTGTGTVTGGNVNCGSTCSASYASGTTVTLTATAASGSTFAGWSGCSSANGTACTVSMTAARTVTATFNGSGGSTGTPCANPITFTGNTNNFNTTGAVCYRTSQRVNGWGCSNFEGRTVSVNGGTATATCGAGPLPLAQSGGYTYFSVSAGQYSWASIYVW